jgi:branched-chain amino acid transport system ATP-binding protein
MLELLGVTAGYRQTTVLRDVDLVVPPASIVALLGPNGAGKTTILRVASGLLRPWFGTVSLDGADVTAMRPHQRADLGLSCVPEGRGVFPSLTVREHIRLAQRDSSETEAVERVAAAFPRLTSRIDQLAGTMSGGEQQMLALARVFLQRPRVVLLDEVSMGLAPSAVEEIFIALRHLAADGAALLIVEQYVHLALDLADYVYVLNRGMVSFVGEPTELAADEVFDHYMGVHS